MIPPQNGYFGRRNRTNQSSSSTSKSLRRKCKWPDDFSHTNVFYLNISVPRDSLYNVIKKRFKRGDETKLDTCERFIIRESARCVCVCPLESMRKTPGAILHDKVCMCVSYQQTWRGRAMASSCLRSDFSSILPRRH